MKVYGSPKTRSDRVVWTLNELDLECEFQSIDFMKGEHLSPEYLAINPNGKVPALVDDDLVLYESAAICLYLAEKAPHKRLIPTDPVLRAKFYQWLFFAFTELEAPLWTMSRHTFVYPEKNRVPEIFKSCMYEFKKRAKTAEDSLAGTEYIVGDSFTLADLILAGVLAWGESHGLLGDFPVCQAYVEKMKLRPAYPS